MRGSSRPLEASATSRRRSEGRRNRAPRASSLFSGSRRRRAGVTLGTLPVGGAGDDQFAASASRSSRSPETRRPASRAARDAWAARSACRSSPTSSPGRCRRRVCQSAIDLHAGRQRVVRADEPLRQPQPVVAARRAAAGARLAGVSACTSSPRHLVVAALENVRLARLRVRHDHHARQGRRGRRPAPFPASSLRHGLFVARQAGCWRGSSRGAACAAAAVRCAAGVFRMARMLAGRPCSCALK